MLGWFKKKFKKKAPAPVEETAIEELTTDTSFSEHEQDENDSIVIDEPIVDEQTPVSELQTDIQETGTVDDPVSPPDSTSEIEERPVTVEEPAPAPDGATSTQTAVKDTAEGSASVDDGEKEVTTVQLDESSPEQASEPEPEVEPETTALTTSEPDSIAEEKAQKDIQTPAENIAPPVADSEKKRTKKSLFSRLTDKLSKTRDTFTYQLDALFLGKKVIDEDMLDDLEELLITADLGVSTTHELLEYARREVKRKELSEPESLKKALIKRITKLILENEADATLVMPEKGPFVVMVIGVNGVGKTTTIGKIANKFIKSGQSVMLVAGDTFRAAAVSQLKIWGERNNIPVVSHKDGADPSAVVFDALGIAVAKDIDVVLVDTAGRLHTQDNLMEELKKIKRVMHKKLPGAPHETMLVIDATTGQNGISQARLFDAAVDITGLTLTKLDGTSKGGIVANICREMKIPIRFIGIGEQMDDLRDFDASEFAEALFQNSYGKHNQ